MADALDTQQIEKALGDLPGWSFDNNKLTRAFKFGDFREAVSFIVRIAFEAEQRQHHPELRNVYNNVTVSLSTHDAGDVVTEKDVDLAKAIQAIDWTAG